MDLVPDRDKTARITSLYKTHMYPSRLPLTSPCTRIPLCMSHDSTPRHSRCPQHTPTPSPTTSVPHSYMHLRDKWVSDGARWLEPSDQLPLISRPSSSQPPSITAHMGLPQKAVIHAPITVWGLKISPSSLDAVPRCPGRTTKGHNRVQLWFSLEHKRFRGLCWAHKVSLLSSCRINW